MHSLFDKARKDFAFWFAFDLFLFFLGHEEIENVVEKLEPNKVKSSGSGEYFTKTELTFKDGQNWIGLT